ncbi:MAG: transposase [Flavobacteriales bacterium Tduv]
MVKDFIGCMRFCCFLLEDQILDHTTLCDFLNEYSSQKDYENLIKKINKELEKH